MLDNASVADSSGFSSFKELQRAHLDLMRTYKPSQEATSGEEDVKSAIRRFVVKVRNTGTVLEKDAERQAAQNILDYWSAETVSIADISEKDWSPEKLLPFAPEADASHEKSRSADAELIALRERARKQIQLGATARLWKDSGNVRGYLLLGKALEEARAFKETDPDIAALVAASEAQSRSEFRVRVLIGIVCVLALLSFWLLYQNISAQKQLAAQNAAVADRAAASNATQVGEQQAKIKALTEELRAAKVSVPSEITETVPDAIIQSNVTKRSSSSAGAPANPIQRGYIWIGSDLSTNLLDTSNSNPVLPSAAVVGKNYKINRNLVLRSGWPSADYIQTDSVGVVPEDTAVQITGPTRSYPRPTPASLLPKASSSPPAKGAAATAPAVPDITPQYWAPVDVEYSDQPIVYLEFAGGNTPAAQALAQKLKAQGFRVPGVEGTDLAKGLNEARFYHQAEKAAAEKLATVVTGAVRELGLTGVSTAKAIDLTDKAGARNFPGVIELWIDLPPPKS